MAPMWRRWLSAVLAGAFVALAGCAAKKPVRPEPAAPPPPPPPVLASHAIGWDALGWPPVVASVAVAAAVAEEATGRPLREPARPARREAAAPEPPARPPVPSSLMLPAMDEAAAVREIREKVAVARRALGALRYEQLSPDARAQFDTVTQLIAQAEEALRARNFVYAVKVADKAATLARRLGGEEELGGGDGSARK